MSTSVDDISSYLTSSTNVTQIDTGDTMGYEDFLSLLSAELENQDPTDPVDNKDMILQLAQFSTLSTLATLNTNMESFISTNTIATVNGFIGKNLSYSQTDSDGNTTTGSGTCTGVNIADDGTITLTVGGTEVQTAEVTGITNATTTTTTTE